MYILPFKQQNSRYSDWLLAGMPRGRSSSPGTGEIFLFPFRPGPASYPVGTGGSLSGSKVKLITHLHSVEVKKEYVIYIATTPCAFMAKCLTS
jgi:hypothetical protein